MNSIQTNLLQETKEAFNQAKANQEMLCDYLYKKLDKSGMTPAVRLHRSYNGVLSGLFNGMKDRAGTKRKGRGDYSHVKMLISKEDFRRFCEINSLQLREMYLEWFASGFDRTKSLTVDRIDSRGNYEIGNIQFLTFKENMDKSWTDWYARIPFEHKRCARCDKNLPKSSFNRNRVRKDGLEPYCRSHMNEIFRNYYHKRKKHD